MVGASTTGGVPGSGVWGAGAGVAIRAQRRVQCAEESLGRANAAKFVEKLCQYPGNPEIIAQAQQHILQAHAERLSVETGKAVTVEDITAGRAPRPKVLDMFAGGGAIPLEALRLGCEAYALDLNPVAHIIQLCTLVYPQKYGKPDSTAKGSAKDGTWAGLAAEVEHWGKWVLEKVRAEIGDLYPSIPDPEFDHAAAPKDSRGKAIFTEPQHVMSFAEDRQLTLAEHPKADGSRTGTGFLTPVAYLWTRTVRCKNPACGATVPMVKQTWLCKKKDRFVAMRVVAPQGEKCVRFEVVEAHTESGLGFDPEAHSKGGNATCPFCGSVADVDYVKAEGCSKRMGIQPMSVVSVRVGRAGKVYLSADNTQTCFPPEELLGRRLQKLCSETRITVPTERVEPNPRSMDTHLFGLTTWADHFTTRQLLGQIGFLQGIREAEGEMRRLSFDPGQIEAIVAMLACAVDKLADFNSTLSTLKPGGGRGIVHTFGRQALPMIYDFAEANPLNAESACWVGCMSEIVGNIEDLSFHGEARVVRGTATATEWPDASFDAILTDPPYYDNVTYSNLADFFYVWLKRSFGHLKPEHFASEATPKKNEAIAAYYRHDGDKSRSRKFYEQMMEKSFREAFRILKPGGLLTVIYAHKTTLGWSTLVDALRRSGFVVVEAWPIDTETKSRLVAMDTASLASSITLVARRREGSESGSYGRKSSAGIGANRPRARRDALADGYHRCRPHHRRRRCRAARIYSFRPCRICQR